MSNPPAFVSFDSISLRFNGKTLYENFSLSVARGENVLIKGPSGCGKSTLLKMALGFVRPDSGTIEVDAQQLNPKTIWEIRRSMAYVPQEPELSAVRAGSVLENCFDYRANQGIKGNLSKIPGLLSAFGLPQSILKQQTRELSGGEKQRLVMIAAILLDRPLILLDEASSALDPESFDKVISYFKSRDDLTILAVSHDEEWEGFADTVVTLSNSGGEHE